MTSSELSNALNPHVAAQRHRRRDAVQNSPALPAVSVATPASAPLVPPNVPHRSELELANTIATTPHHSSVHVVPANSPDPPPHNVPTVVQEFYRLMAIARDATVAERRRRIAWEQEQQAKNIQVQAEMERRMLDMQQELTMLKAYISMHPNMIHPTDAQGQDIDIVQIIPSTARIEPLSPVLESLPQTVSAVSPVPNHTSMQYPTCAEGSSLCPSSAPHLSSPYHSPSPALYTLSPAQTPELFVDIDHVPGPSTPQSIGLSPIPAPSLPVLEQNPRKRPRHVDEDDSDYDSASEDSDTTSTARSSKRKNGHDGRCLTIHHAMRIHIRKLMKLEHGEALPDGPFEGVTIGEDEPVRFVWQKTTKQSSTNTAMKKRVVSSLRGCRNKYKHVPDEAFGRRNLEAAFEQVFTTLRQKYKAQKDSTTASQLKRREDRKALKARRLHRKKTKLANRIEARSKITAFSQPIFEGALQQECMSSEESDGDFAEVDGDTVQVFRLRGLPWRSARLVRFYRILDEQDKFEKSTQPKRGTGRRERREGSLKDGLFLPPKGVARWMINRCWLEETIAMRPDLSDILGELIVDPTEPEADIAHLMLGSETSDDESEQTPPGASIYAHVSDTSYSLHNALQPIPIS